ncbi:hypothetical protein MUS1_02955 [Marinomonas ushuaiensis DSM 15871]|uniref:Uncharacterized protein n=1 Tax=Marinomonas ushuaiensis DSM 15871 TaxID=1122207 RepID=X7EC47_9GAMM|nr:sulfotransferase [Marinomonas ushuaiensis]ETX12703.1 hypothetical protein MUS1_02955 [Marinomonas ushuaiensis DSM 15871]
MTSRLALFREMAEQQEYSALYQACCEQQDDTMYAGDRTFQLLFAVACAHVGEQSKAQSLLLNINESLQISPLCSVEKLDLSAVFLALERLDEATFVLDELLNEEYSLSVVLARKASCELMKGKCAVAYDLYLKSLSYDDSNAEIWLNLCLLLLDQYREANIGFGTEKDPLLKVREYLIKAEIAFEASEHRYSFDRQDSLLRQIDNIRFEYWVINNTLEKAEAWLYEYIEDCDFYISRVILYSEALLLENKSFIAETVLLNTLRKYPESIACYQALVALSSRFQREKDSLYYRDQYEQRAKVNIESQQVIKLNESLSESDEFHLQPLSFSLNERIKARFTRAFIDSRITPLCTLDKSLFSPVFIIGLPFSGCTLVEQILLANNKVSSVGESSHISVLVEGLNFKQREKGSLRVYPELVDMLSLNQWKALASGVQSFCMGKINTNTTSIVLDKGVHNVHHIGMIKCLFPKARFISVRRDSKSYVLSEHVTEWIKSEGNTSQTVPYSIGEKLQQYSELMSYWKSLFSNDILEVNFNSLIEQPNEISKSLFSFLGLLTPNHSINSTHDFSSYTKRKVTVDKAKQDKNLSELFSALNKKTIITDDMAFIKDPDLLSSVYSHFQHGAYREAEIACKKILRVIPDYPPVHHILSELYLRSGLFEKAVQSLETALRLAPWKEVQWARDLNRAKRITEEYQLNGVNNVDNKA